MVNFLSGEHLPLVDAIFVNMQRLNGSQRGKGKGRGEKRKKKKRLIPDPMLYPKVE